MPGLEAEFRRHHHVGRRIAERAAEPLAARHLGFRRETVAEEAGGLDDVALAEQRADAARRDDLGILVAEGVDQRHAEAFALAGGHEEGRAALATVAEMEVEAGHDMRDGQAFVEDVPDEVLRRALAKRPAKTAARPPRRSPAPRAAGP